MPKAWDAKKTAIEEANDLSSLTLSLLKEKLMAYQSHIDATEEAKGSKEAITFKAKEVAIDESDSDNSSDKSDNINFLARRISRILRKNQGKKFVKKFETKKYDAGKMYKDKDKKMEKKEEKK